VTANRPGPRWRTSSTTAWSPSAPLRTPCGAGEPYLYHSRLSAALNLKLLDPREVLDAAVAAFDAGRAPIASVEGFVRQILGWREYVRGIYWLRMPGIWSRTPSAPTAPLPGFYWSGDTDYACLRDAVGQVVRLGYGHHIQRLMVTGLFALLLGVEPSRCTRGIWPCSSTRWNGWRRPTPSA
jgi:deoxyribodipyrimidine photolyase-related protein